MLQKDLKVKRPAGTKIYQQKTHRYVYHVVASEYQKEKQYVLESRVCIGKMIDEEYMNPNDHYFEYYPSAPILIREVEFSDARQIATVVLLWKIIDDLGLGDLLDEIHGLKAALIRDLVCYVIIRQ